MFNNSEYYLVPHFSFEESKVIGRIIEREEGVPGNEARYQGRAMGKHLRLSLTKLYIKKMLCCAGANFLTYNLQVPWLELNTMPQRQLSVIKSAMQSNYYD